MGVEASVLGAFTDSGHFRASFGAKPVADLPMEFLHEGVPQLRLSAAWKSPQVEKPLPKIMGDADSWGELLRRILGRLNVCSKEYVVRQYDHEVQGGSVIKPMVGAHADGPSDAGVIRPVLSSERGLVMSHGICPKYSDFDTYWMTAGAVDEAVRNAVATGADPDQMVGVDNFCWCDPVQSDKTPDGEYKLAQLVRSCRALAHFCTAYGVPCISGKDSMKNDYTGGGEKISIPPTLLYTVVGIVPDIKHCVSSDFKHPGEYIYVLGRTLDETAGSEVAAELGYAGQGVPQVDAQAAMVRYRAAHQAMRNGLITACHDCSDGGLAAALAEMSIGGRLGADVNLDAMPAPVELPLISRLFAESHSRLLVTVKPGREDEFEAAFAGQQFARLGQVTGQDRFVIQHQGVPVLDQSVRELAEAFKGTLGW